MTNHLKPLNGTETASAATPEKDETERTEKSSSPATSEAASHIVDATEKWLGRSIIITGAPDPKKHFA